VDTERHHSFGHDLVSQTWQLPLTRIGPPGLPPALADPGGAAGPAQYPGQRPLDILGKTRSAAAARLAFRLPGLAAAGDTAAASAA
jgi:hypothetical protein